MLVFIRVFTRTLQGFGCFGRCGFGGCRFWVFKVWVDRGSGLSAWVGLRLVWSNVRLGVGGFLSPAL